MSVEQLGARSCTWVSDHIENLDGESARDEIYLKLVGGHAL